MYKQIKKATLMFFVAAVTATVFTGCVKDDDILAAINAGMGAGVKMQYVDLGLPSGLEWAKCNLGADNAEEYGTYFAWGETVGKKKYTWKNYAYGEAYNKLTKYCCLSEYGLDGYTDTLICLLHEDDAATANLYTDPILPHVSIPHIPTADDWKELFNNTDVQWTTVKGVKGLKCTARNGTDSSIFLPAAGYMDGDKVCMAGSFGNYWSSSLGLGDPYDAWGFRFVPDRQSMSYYCRYYGQSVRAVR